MATIKKGTYRFNDVLTEGENEFEQPIKGFINTTVYGDEYTSYFSGFLVNGISNTLIVFFDYSEPALPIEQGFPVTLYHYDPTYGHEGWEFDTYGSGIQTITITEDTEVSDEFSTWFTANAKREGAEPTATITYNGSTIASLFGGQTATLKCKGDNVKMLSDIVVEVVEQNESGGSDANIVPLLVGDVGTYDTNSPILMTETFTGGGEPDAVYNYFGMTLPYFKAKKLVATKDIVSLVKNESLADKLYVEMFGEISPLWQMEHGAVTETAFCIISNNVPSLIWIFGEDTSFSQEKGFEVGGVYLIDAWSLMGATGEISISALGIPDKPIDGFMPVDVVIPLEDELQIKPMRMNWQTFDDGTYYRKIVVEPIETEYLTVTPTTSEQKFSLSDYYKCYSGVTVKAVDSSIIADMGLLCGIYLDKFPKTEFKVGDSFDFLGGALSLVYTNGTLSRINLTISDIENFEEIQGKMSTVGTHNVFVVFTDGGVTSKTMYQIKVTE